MSDEAIPAKSKPRKKSAEDPGPRRPGRGRIASDPGGKGRANQKSPSRRRRNPQPTDEDKRVATAEDAEAVVPEKRTARSAPPWNRRPPLESKRRASAPEKRRKEVGRGEEDRIAPSRHRKAESGPKKRRQKISQNAPKKGGRRTYMEGRNDDEFDAAQQKSEDDAPKPSLAKKKKKLEEVAPPDTAQPETNTPPGYSSPKDPRPAFLTAVCKKGVKGVVKEFIRELKPKPKEQPEAEAFEKNERKNRYADVTCLDQTRVVLQGRPADDDYIHASYVTPNAPNAQRYIAAQGPTADTVDDYWQLVVQEKAGCIVMLCNLFEGGAEKCAPYYPTTCGEVLEVPPFRIKATAVQKAVVDTATVSQLEVDNGEGTSSVTHIQWLDWPDHTAPHDSRPVLALLRLAKQKAQGRVIVVHCSAGIGRTGTFIALDFINAHLVASKCKTTMAEAVKELRKQRAFSVQSSPQYVFLHVALVNMLVADGVIKERGKIFRDFQADFEKYMQRITERHQKQAAEEQNNKSDGPKETSEPKKGAPLSAPASEKPPSPKTAAPSPVEQNKSGYLKTGAFQL